MTTIPSGDYGVAGIQTDAFTGPVELLAGDTPAVVTDYCIPGATLAGTGIPQWTPVFVDPATRAVTLAVQGTTAPNAITVCTLEAGSAAATTLPIYKVGCFNINALNWPASYDTTAERISAFAAAAGTLIIIKEPYYA